MRPFDGEPLERIRVALRKRQPGTAARRRAPQDRVHEPGGAAPCGARQADARVDGGVRGHAIEEEQLVEPEAQRGAHRRVEACERHAHEAGQVVVEPALPGERAVDELRRERAVGAGEAGAGEPVGEEHVGERVRRLDADEDLVREAARVAAGGYPSPRHVPGASRLPGDERGGGESAAALELHLEQAERPGPGRDDDAVGARRRATVPGVRRGRPARAPPGAPSGAVRRAS